MSVERFAVEPGYEVSRLIKGGWHLAGGHGSVDRDDAVRDMAAFVEAGITTFDCADIYTGVEELIGEFRVACPGVAPDVQIHTKYVPDLGTLSSLRREDVERIVDRSLRRLRVERLDLVQYYWWDPDGIPGFVETGLWLDEIRRAGKIARIGTSNFNTAQLLQLADAGVPVVANQPQYSPLDLRPERSLIPACRERGIPQLCYGTLAGGFLSADWIGASEPRDGFENRSLAKYKLIVDDFGGWGLFQELLRALQGVADKHGRSVSQVALRWVLDRPMVAAAIVGATSTRHLEENLGAFEFALDEEDAAAIDAVTARRTGPAGDCFDLERDRSGRHGRVMRYNLNSGDERSGAGAAY